MSNPDEGLDHLVDRDALEAFLTDQLGPADRFSIQRHQQGHSNETVFVTWGDRELVLRRPPAGETANSAHDVLREAQFIDAVSETHVPVPDVVATCEDATVIGGPFFLTDRLTGDVVRNSEPDRFATPAYRQQIGEELVDTLVAIHAVDWQTVGLDRFGPGDDYLDEQISLWREQLEEWLIPKTQRYRELPGVQDVAEWLTANVPEETETTLVHGDYKLDNVMFGPGTPPDLSGVFDWEMATIGDPLADLGWLCLFWPEADDPKQDIPDQLVPTIPTRDGYPTRQELIARYEQATRREFVSQRFYRALAAYKILTACEAMYLRHVTGTADDPMYHVLEEGVPAMARRAQRIIDGEEPV